MEETTIQFRKKRNSRVVGKDARLSKVMPNFYDTEGMTLEDAKGILEPIVDDLIYLYEKVFLPIDKDPRGGEETYGYKDEESILGDLQYISDRWRSAFRVRWMINLIRPDYEPNYKPGETK